MSAQLGSFFFCCLLPERYLAKVQVAPAKNSIPYAFSPGGEAHFGIILSRIEVIKVNSGLFSQPNGKACSLCICVSNVVFFFFTSLNSCPGSRGAFLFSGELACIVMIDLFQTGISVMRRPFLLWLNFQSHPFLNYRLLENRESDPICNSLYVLFFGSFLLPFLTNLLYTPPLNRQQKRVEHLASYCRLTQSRCLRSSPRL